MKGLFALIFIVIGCTQGPKTKVNSVPSTGKRNSGRLDSSAINPVDTNTVWLFVFNGESNSNGRALNDSATMQEISSRPEVQILNNTTFTFQNLDVGTNNEIDLNQLPADSLHGWELELANLRASGEIQNPVYVVKAGWGGSRIADWKTGGTIFNKMTRRVDSARAILSRQGKNVRLVWWYHLGINDFGVGTSQIEWQDAVLAYFAQVRTLYGTSTPIIYPLLMKGTGSFNTYISNVAISAGNVYTIIDVSDLTLRDSYHWGYSGMKTLCDRMWAITKGLF